MLVEGPSCDTFSGSDQATSQSVQPTPASPTPMEGITGAWAETTRRSCAAAGGHHHVRDRRDSKSQAGARERLTMHGTSLYAFKETPAHRSSSDRRSIRPESGLRERRKPSASAMPWSLLPAV